MTSRSHRRQRILVSIVAWFVLATLVLAVVATAARAAPVSLSISVSESNGTGRISRPGRACADGGEGASWHYDYSAPLPAGKLSALKGQIGFHLDLHSDLLRETPIAPVKPTASAFLLGEESHSALSNERGVVVLRMRTHDTATLSCSTPNVTFDGTTASGSGTWRVGETTGSYRDATGTGTFTFTSEVAPGADNAYTLNLNGSVDVLKPSLKVEVIDSYWAFLGADYLLRRVTVVYRVTNNGPGDAFGVRLNTLTSPTPGVTVLGPVPQFLADLHEGESQTVRVRFKLGTTQPCSAVILSCEFDTTLGVLLPDALDVPATYSQTVRVKAPEFPPPL